MARLRRDSGEDSDPVYIPKRRTQRPAGEAASTSREPRRRRRTSNSDTDDASEKPVPKTVAAPQQKKTQIRLGGLKALEKSDSFSISDVSEDLRTKSTKKRNERKEKLQSALSQTKFVEPEPEPMEPEGELGLDEVDEEVDVEESIWCGDIDPSESSSDDDLPSPRTLFGPPRTGPNGTKKSPAKQPKPGFTRQLQALSIFDDEEAIAPRKKPQPAKRPKDALNMFQSDDVELARKKPPQSKPPKEAPRPISSSDKENKQAIIHFSPPRARKPQDRDQIERPSTPPPPPSPSKAKLHSPTKRAPRVPTPPLRPSLDAFWTADAINDWNDQYSPQKPLKSPRKFKLLPDSESATPTASPGKLQSPFKRTKEQLEARKTFEARKVHLAETFLAELDQTITQGRISTLAESTGGVQLIWSKTLNSTAGRANWRRESTKSTRSGTTTTTHKHYASIELASKVIDCEHRLLNVIAHEFCHLANFMVSGIKNQPHGASFKAWGKLCSKAFGDRGVEVTTKHTYEIEYKYIWQCKEEGCGMEFKRHSKSIDPVRHRCGGCRGVLVQVKPVPRGTKGGTPGIGGGKTGEKAPVTGYAAFVKMHFAELKKGMPGSSHKEVTEALGRKYRAEKVKGAEDEKSASVDSVARDLGDLKLGHEPVVIALD